MSNSVVRVTDSMLNDSLLLLVGEDGTVTPDKETVETYLSSKPGATNIQVMHINKCDGQTIDVAVDNVVYVPDAQPVIEETVVMDEVALILRNIKLDHDYTPHLEPPHEELDELTKTLSFLDGHNETETEVITQLESPKSVKSSKESDQIPSIPKPKIKQASPKLKKEKPKPRIPKELIDEDYSDSDEEYDGQDDNDSDYELEDLKQKRIKKSTKQKSLKVIKMNKSKSPVKISPLKLKQEIQPPKEEKPEKPPEPPQEVKPLEKKPVKKEKKQPKPIPDDFALFSTPDIIRRVGGKEPTHPETSTPAKIENRSKSVNESPQTSIKHNRLSLDGKISEKPPVKGDVKKKPEIKPKRLSLDGRKSTEPSPNKSLLNIEAANVMDGLALSDDLNAMINEDSKSLSNNLSLAANDINVDQSNIGIDSGGLDLDPSLLDNINSDEISDDILYQVAQSLVSNTELQNAIDKMNNEGNLVLETPMEQGTQQEPELKSHHSTSVQQESSSSHQRGTQIVRSDGRVVVIPPIERPTTRSRNKKESDKLGLKFVHKPLDEEHVSGNEFDSSDDEEESEDDPNKLWCICNQPHNNRFMICCDTCEEWYHGKCVNITKAMGQQMESEGREWICLFCNDPHLKRPQAAARRIRKASRNSRQSSDSAGSSKPQESSSGSMPCVVCQKPARLNSIYCSENCILSHAQGVEKVTERVVVFERSSGNMLSGSRAPSASNLDQWLKEHPGYEVVKAQGKVVTSKQTQSMAQSKLKIVKNTDNDGVSLAINKKGVNVGVLKHLPKNQLQVNKTSPKVVSPAFKIISKQVPTTSPKPKVVQVTKTPSAPVTPAKPKTPQSTVKTTPPPNKEKTLPVKTPKSRQAEQTSTTPQPKQENIRENVQRTVFEQLTNRLKMADDLKLSEEEVKNISFEIESQLYKCFGDTGQKYRNKYRSLIFNIKDIKNQTLWRRICEKSINPYQLVRLSPDDMASQELALWREREAKHQLDMIKKSELELLSCNRQYVMKTHKGEQILEDNRPTDRIDNSEVITSLTDGAPTEEKNDSKRDSSKDRDRKSSKHSHRDKERKSSKEKSDHRHRSSSKDRDRSSRKRSRSKDRTSRSDRKRSRSRGRDKHRKSSHKSSKHKKDSYRGSSTDKLDKKSKEILEHLVDNKIVPPLEDRLWKHVSQEDIVPTSIAESDSDHEPTSTVTIPTPPRVAESDEYQETPDVKSENLSEKEKPEFDSSMSPTPKVKSEKIWKGIINMIDVAQISITAHEVSGDCNGLGTELPPNLDIVGRISPDTVWDYIGKMKCSNSKVISLVRLDAINVEEKMPYLALYSYLSSRNRLGVVKSNNKAVKDFYILPLAAQKPIPQALLPINGPGFEEQRPALLLGIIVRDKRKRPLIEPVAPVVHSSKKQKTEASQSNSSARSYTPPPVKEVKPKLPLPPSVPDEDDDEPYSPEDSDPDSGVPPISEESSSLANPSFLDNQVDSSFQPFSKKFDDIPGLGNPTLPSSTQEIQRQMEKLNQQIEMQKSEINSISQNIATASTDLGSSALANISLPSNLQQILDSIKTIRAVSTADTPEAEPPSSNPVQDSSDLTIPLILPTSFSRPLNTSSNTDSSENTIPLNLPTKKKSAEPDKPSSVLSSLSEEDLIRKAEEMLGESKKKEPSGNNQIPTFNFSSNASKRSKIELEQPPVPGLEDDVQ